MELLRDTRALEGARYVRYGFITLSEPINEASYPMVTESMTDVKMMRAQRTWALEGTRAETYCRRAGTEKEVLDMAESMQYILKLGVESVFSESLSGQDSSMEGIYAPS